MGISLKRDQRGIAHLVVPIVIIVILAVGGVGYYVWHNQQNSGSTVSSTPAQAAASKEVSDACNTALKDKDFCKFAANLGSLTKYRSTFTNTTAGVTATVIVETDGSNTSLTEKQGGQELLGYVTIGNDSYTKDETDGTWTKTTSADSSATTPNIKDDIKASDFSGPDASKTKYTKVGTEACGSLTCFKYQITDTTTPDAQTFVWFDNKDFQLRRISVTSSGTTSDIAITYDSVSVTAPSPIKS